MKTTLKSRIAAMVADGLNLGGITETLYAENPNQDKNKLKRKISVYLAQLRKAK